MKQIDESCNIDKTFDILRRTNYTKLLDILIGYCIFNYDYLYIINDDGKEVKKEHEDLIKQHGWTLAEFNLALNKDTDDNRLR